MIRSIGRLTSTKRLNSEIQSCRDSCEVMNDLGKMICLFFLRICELDKHQEQAKCLKKSVQQKRVQLREKAKGK